MNILLIQPPFTQLNTPYPAIHYLESFLKKEDFENNLNIQKEDLSIEFFNYLFSPSVLREIFNTIDINSVEKKDLSLLLDIEKTISTTQKFLSSLKNSDSTIDFFLTKSLQYNYGPLVKSLLESNNYQLLDSDAKILATYFIQDIANIITKYIDSEFALIKYGEKIATGQPFFEPIEKQLDSSKIIKYYSQFLKNKFTNKNYDFVLITIPFPGNLIPALSTAKFFNESKVIFGGGYVNTELRNIKTDKIFKYTDYLVFDKGLFSLKQILINNKTSDIFKTITKNQNTLDKLISNQDEAFEYEQNIIKSLTPNYKKQDFDNYLNFIDSTNPMHSMWSKGQWIKVFLAHGCYWQKCKFCDTSLDYICDYIPTKIDEIFNNLLKIKEETGISGIHFIDEALPINQLIQFAKLNLKHNRPFTFWGNIRFESNISSDLITFLANAGLIAISAGIESPGEKSLKQINKGIALEEVIRICYDMKINGVLVHTYLIYGLHFQGPEDILDGMELVRQLFQYGLIDSAFWHRFTLTRHSIFYKEFINHNSKILKPIDYKWDFANNDLDFENSSSFDKYALGLEQSLSSWLLGIDINKESRSWFKFKLPQPNIPKYFVSKIIDNIQLQEFDLEKLKNKKIIWLGSNFIIKKLDDANCKLFWTFNGNVKNIKTSIMWAEFLKNIFLENSITNINNNLTIKTFAQKFKDKTGFELERFMLTKNFEKLKLYGLLFI